MDDDFIYAEKAVHKSGKDKDQAADNNKLIPEPPADDRIIADYMRNREKTINFESCTKKPR